jgi:hypothetical protein
MSQVARDTGLSRESLYKALSGVRHRFQIQSMHVGTGHAMYAREVTNRDAAGGYRFGILGNHETDARRIQASRPLSRT